MRLSISDVTISVELLEPTAQIPTKAHEHDACFDLYASRPATLHPGTVTEVHTGIRLLIPEGWEGQIRPRSSLGRRGLQVHPGTIDAYYTGEITILFFNFTREPYHIEIGDRVAQIAFRSVPGVELVESPVILPDPTLRGERGFGSSGR